MGLLKTAIELNFFKEPERSIKNGTKLMFFSDNTHNFFFSSFLFLW